MPQDIAVGSARRGKGVDYRFSTAGIDLEDDAATKIEIGLTTLVASEDRRPIEIAAAVARQPRVRLSAARTLLKCNENMGAPLPGRHARTTPARAVLPESPEIHAWNRPRVARSR